MSTGRFILRGRVFQGRAFGSRALADSGVAPEAVTLGGGVVAGFRSRTITTGIRARSAVAEFRSRTITMEKAR
jgi:hypothetical protein